MFVVVFEDVFGYFIGIVYCYVMYVFVEYIGFDIWDLVGVFDVFYDVLEFFGSIGEGFV